MGGRSGWNPKARAALHRKNDLAPGLGLGRFTGFIQLMFSGYLLCAKPCVVRLGVHEARPGVGHRDTNPAE